MHHPTDQRWNPLCTFQSFAKIAHIIAIRGAGGGRKHHTHQALWRNGHVVRPCRYAQIQTRAKLNIGWSAGCEANGVRKVSSPVLVHKFLISCFHGHSRNDQLCASQLLQKWKAIKMMHKKRAPSRGTSWWLALHLARLPFKH